MAEMTAGEVSRDSLGAGLEIRNGIFGPIGVEDWLAGEEKTAAIAFDGEETVGFIPLFFRDFLLGPGITIRTAFENCVGTKESYRSRGVGAAMIGAACQFLKGRADSLYVYRGDERSKGYRFYAKTGHIDLLHTRPLKLLNPKTVPHPGVVVAEGPQEIPVHEERLLELFQDTWHRFGGFPPRQRGYYRRALGTAYFAARPNRFFLFRLIENGRTTAYLIAAKDRREDLLRVMEMAAAGGDEERVRTVLESAAAHGAALGLQGVAIEAGSHHPFGHLLERVGFVAGPRSKHVMALSFDSAALFQKVWRPRLQLSGIGLQVWTPAQDLTLLEPDGPGARTVVLEMKDDTLTQWLMGRVDFRARVREGTITVLNGNQAVIEAIARAVPYFDWEYHHLDYC